EREGQELWALREARVVEAHPRLRDDLHRIAHAGYAAELIHELTRAGQPADALFVLMEDFLTRLEAGVASSARLRALELLALESAGFAPELAACARCGSEVPPGRAEFDPDAGGVVCSRCTGATRAGTPLALTHGARVALLQLRAGGLAADARGLDDACAQAQRPLRLFLQHHVGRTLRSVDFLAQVGAPQ